MQCDHLPQFPFPVPEPEEQQCAISAMILAGIELRIASTSALRRYDGESSRRSMRLVFPPAGRTRPWITAFALYAAAAVVGTWPLVLRLSTHLPLGSLSNATVPLFNLWTFEWNVQSLSRGYAGYWDAPIFYPTPGTFALSEAQSLTSLGFAALTAAVSGVTAYNLVLLITLIANALAARRLMRVLGASDAAATATGLLALGLPFVWKELGVLQLTVLWPVWLALSELAIVSGARGVLAVDGADSATLPAQRGAATVRLALWCAAIVWTCTYYALFISIFLLLAAALFARREFARPPLRGATLLAVLLLLVAAYPLIAQQRVVGAYARSTKTIYEGGATARAYSRLPRGALGAHVLPPLAAKPSKRSLYPGTLLLLLAALGAWSRISRRGSRASSDVPSGVPQAPTTRFFLWCGISIVLALVLSFGARWGIGSFRPYEVVLERWPGFGNARSPYRFAVFVQIFALVFAGVGFEVLRRAPWRRRAPGRWRGLLLAAAVAVGFIEAMPFEARLERFPVEALQAGWVEFLAQHPGGAVAMVPPALTGKVEDFEPTTVAMLQGLRHGHPLLNGYSGFFPRTADAYIDALKQFPNSRSKRLLARLPVRYAVVDKAWLGARIESELMPLQRVFDSPTHAIFLVPERAR
jgi:hypothetical protein